MADKLNVSIVSPERELYTGAVDQVDLPGAEGNLGILPDHAPLMTAIRTGAITVFDGQETLQFFVQGGFADVTPDGLTVLAERALPLQDVSKDDLATEIEKARADIVNLSDEAELARRQDLEGLESIFNLV